MSALLCARSSGPDSTPDDRRAALRGFVYSPFGMNDLVHGLIGKAVDDVGLEIFDDTDMNEHMLMGNHFLL